MSPSPRTAKRGDLLSDQLRHWLAEPTIAFQSWITKERTSSSSEEVFRAARVTVYCAIWNHFIAHCAERRANFAEITAHDMQQFFSRLDANLEHRMRYRLILLRVFEYLRELGLKSDNPALALFEDDFMTERNAPMPFLSRHQRGDLLDFLYTGPEVPDHPSSLQDMALTALLLGAGIKVGEALRAPDMLDVQEAARLLEVNDGVVYHLIRTKKLRGRISHERRKITVVRMAEIYAFSLRSRLERTWRLS